MKKKNILIVTAAVVLSCTAGTLAISGAAQHMSQPAAVITADEAKEIAASSVAGLTDAEQTLTKCKLDSDDGKFEYEIKITAGDAAYEYDIDATTGAITDYDIDYLKTSKQQLAQKAAAAAALTDGVNYITEEKAQELAQAAVKALTDETQTLLRTKFSYDDGYAEYDVKILTDSAEYDIELNAVTGAVTDTDVDFLLTGTDATQTAGDATATIGADAAKKIAADKAGIALEAAAFTEVKLDSEDGRMVYEIEFYANGLEYEAEIDAVSGTVLEFEIDD